MLKFTRFRRFRKSELMRDLFREVRVHVDDLVYPIFVVEGKNIKQPVNSMPGICRYSTDRIDEELDRVVEAGVKAVLLFGVPDHKDETASGAYYDNGVTQRTIRHIKEKYGLLVIADVCLCEYMSHGHCGVVRGNVILNDETLPLLGKTALSLTKAGADIVAPSDMMDGRVAYIRDVLDKGGFTDTMIMAYSAKFASAYYSPFRDAADSAPAFGDRRTYQMDPANGREAFRECIADIDEGADVIMIKPALPYLDIVKEVSTYSNVPVAAYNVSGEYAMVKAASMNGWINEELTVIENLTSIKRAGAGIIISYHALEAAKWLKEY